MSRPNRLAEFLKLFLSVTDDEQTCSESVGIDAQASFSDGQNVDRAGFRPIDVAEAQKRSSTN